MPIDDALDKIESNGVREEPQKEEDQDSLNTIKTGLEEYMQKIGSLSPEEIKQYSEELKYIKEKTEKITEIIKGYDKPVEPARPATTPTLTATKKKTSYIGCVALIASSLFILHYGMRGIVYIARKSDMRFERNAYSVTVKDQRAKIIPIIDGFSGEVGTKVEIYDEQGNLNRIIYDERSSGAIGDFGDYVTLFDEEGQSKTFNPVMIGADLVTYRIKESVLEESNVMYKEVLEEASKLRGKQHANR